MAAFLVVLVVFAAVVAFVLGVVAAAVVVFLVMLLPFGYVAIRMMRADPKTRRNWLTALRITLKWPWVSASLGIVSAVPRDRLAWYRFLARRRHGMYVRRPIIWPMVDQYGVTLRMWTVPNVTRKLVSERSPQLANAWRCHRVGVIEVRPGLLDVRGLRFDPLLEGFPMEIGESDPRTLRTGRDEWGRTFHVNLAQVPGVTIGGLPGKGKTTHVFHWMAQLAPDVGSQFVVVDGKGQDDYVMWKDRCWRYVDNDLSRARDALREAYELMKLRQSMARVLLESRDAWRAPRYPWWPLVMIVIDECHTFFRGKGHDEALAKQIKFYVEELVKKGRAVMMTTILMTQKQTSDAVPTEIRDNCEIGMCFPVRTSEAAVAALGDDIRKFPDMNPVLLQGSEFMGVATVNNTVEGGFVRVKCPIVDDAFVERMAADTVHLRANPMRLLRREMKSRGVDGDSTVVPIDLKRPDWRKPSGEAKRQVR